MGTTDPMAGISLQKQYNYVFNCIKLVSKDSNKNKCNDDVH